MLQSAKESPAKVFLLIMCNVQKMEQLKNNNLAL